MSSKFRFNVVLTPEMYNWIVRKASSQGRPPSNLAAFLLTKAVEEEIKKDDSNQPNSD